MTITISRLYNDYSTAAKVVAELKAAGLRESEISIIANNADNWYAPDRKRDTKTSSGRVDRDHDGTDDRVEGAETGAGVGAGVGSAVGLLAGLGLIAIPGIGPVVAAGWLVSTLAGTAAGAATGGIIGALSGRCEGRGCTHLCRRRETWRNACRRASLPSRSKPL